MPNQVTEHRSNFLFTLPKNTEVTQYLRQLWNIKTIYKHFEALHVRVVAFSYPPPTSTHFHLLLFLSEVMITVLEGNADPEWPSNRNGRHSCKLCLYSVLTRFTTETEQIPIKSGRGNKLQLFPAPGWKEDFCRF